MLPTACHPADRPAPPEGEIRPRRVVVEDGEQQAVATICGATRFEANCCSEIRRAQRLAPFGIGTVHGCGYRLEAEDRRRLTGMIEEHKDFVSKDNCERAIPCSDCSRSEGKIVEMVLIRIEPSGVSG